MTNNLNSQVQQQPEHQPLKFYDITSGSADLEAAVSNAEKYLSFQDRIRKAAVKLTSVSDWSDMGGNPYLEWSGAAKIAMAFGVSYSLDSIIPETCKDEIGEFIEYTVAGSISWNGRSVTEIGTGSSRDEFFGLRSRTNDSGQKEKYYLPLSEVDRTSVKKKAMTNFMNRGLKSLIGLSFSWDEISEITSGRISKESMKASGRSVSYDRGKKGGSQDDPETAKKRGEIRSMILELCNGDKVCARAKLKELTTWQKDGKTFEGKESTDDLSPKQVNYLYPRIKLEYDKIGGAQ